MFFILAVGYSRLSSKKIKLFWQILQQGEFMQTLTYYIGNILSNL